MLRSLRQTAYPSLPSFLSYVWNYKPDYALAQLKTYGKFCNLKDKVLLHLTPPTSPVSTLTPVPTLTPKIFPFSK